MSVPPRGILEIPLDGVITTPTDATREFVVAESTVTANAFWYFVEDPELVLAAPRDALTASVESGADVTRITVTASGLVKDLFLQADRVASGATVASGLVTLLPGESHTFVVDGTSGGADPADVGVFPVLCSVNDLVTG